MSPADRQELAATAKQVHMAVGTVPAAVVALAVAGVRCLLELDPFGGRECVVCGMVRRHRCSCPFHAGQLPKWVRRWGG